MSARVYGWRKQPDDPRDYHFRAPAPVIASLPPVVDFRPGCPPVYDQGRIGSCTANAIAAAIQFCQIKEGIPNFTPSRLFIYWNERNIEGTVSRDAGAVIRDGIKVVNTVGACAEKNWSYDDTPADPMTGVWAPNAKPRTKPNCLAYRYAKDADAVAYLAVEQTIDQMRACLAQGFPFVFGFQVFPAFESQAVAASGVVPIPSAGEQPIGGHAVLAVGYDDARRVFFVRNSWGASWGKSGYFEMPYDYLANRALASDLWTIRQV
jgi:C1A family cysteine protease